MSVICNPSRAVRRSDVGCSSARSSATAIRIFTYGPIAIPASFPLHSGRILGLPGRILISVMGIVVAALSVTGVVIWYRKRRARLALRRPTVAEAIRAG